MLTLTIASLGDFQLWRELTPIPGDAWPTQKSKSLFKILLSARGQLVTTEQLMEWLWPDLLPSKARNNLWVAVSQARRVLEPELPPRGASSFLISTDVGYRLALGEAIQWDVEAFLAATARLQANLPSEARLALLEEAQACYNGDYLVEDRYEEWALPLREELQRLYLKLLLELGECYAEAGRYEDAATQARAVLAREVAAEPAYQALMRYAYFMGDQRTALQTYDACVRVLRSELDAKPLAFTTELYRQIQRRTLPRPMPPIVPAPATDTIYTLTHTPFVGRTREVNALIQALHTARAGTGQVVLVEGEPGIGKSRLLQETLDYARAQDVLTLVTHCYQVEQAIPYQPVIDMLDQAMNNVPANRFLALPPVYLAELATLSPELRELAPDLPSAAEDVSARQARRLRALHQCLELLAGDQGLVLAVDDVHWADHATWQFIHHLASHITTLPLLLICTYRAEEVAVNPELATFVDSMVRTPQATRLPLQRLSADDTDLFLEQLTGSTSANVQLGQWLHAETDGNPFFLVSILQCLVEQRLLSEDRPIWQIDAQRLDISDATLALPDALRESVRTRLRRLPQPMRRVLEAAAVLGRRFDFATLAAVSGESGLALLEMVEALIERQLLRETGEGESYDFSHDKVREVVYIDLSSARRILLHRVAAETLANAEGMLRERAATLAHHYELGQVWDQALYYLIEAADRSRDLFAVREAVQFYDRAIDLTTRFPDLTETGTILDLYMRRGEVRSLFGGQMQGAVADLQRVVEAAQASGDQDRQRIAFIALGQVYRMADQLDAATEYLTAALELCRAQGDQHSLANVLHHLGTVAWSAGNNFHASLYHQEALELCGRLQVEDIVTVQALHGRAEAFIAAARPNQAIPMFEESLLIAQRIGNRRYEGENLQMIGWSTLGLAGTADYGRARKALEMSLEISIDSHLAWNSDVTLSFLGWVLACQGEYRKGLTLIKEAIERLRADGLVRFLSMAYDFLGHIYQDLNLPEAALEAHTTGLNTALTGQVGFWMPRLSANVVIARLRLGDLSAVGELEVAFAVAMEDYQRFHAVRALEGLMEAGITRGEPDRTLHYAEVLEDMCRLGDLRELQVQVHRWRSAAHRLLGEAERAQAELEKAKAAAASIERPRLRWELHAEALALATMQGDLAQAALHQKAMNTIAQAIAHDLQDPDLCRGLFEAALPIGG
jgi:DNA-binding SARP family transcriptional activator